MKFKCTTHARLIGGQAQLTEGKVYEGTYTANSNKEYVTILVDDLGDASDYFAWRFEEVKEEPTVTSNTKSLLDLVTQLSTDNVLITIGGGSNYGISSENIYKVCDTEEQLREILEALLVLSKYTDGGS